MIQGILDGTANREPQFRRFYIKHRYMFLIWTTILNKSVLKWTLNEPRFGIIYFYPGKIGIWGLQHSLWSWKHWKSQFFYFLLSWKCMENWFFIFPHILKILKSRPSSKLLSCITYNQSLTFHYYSIFSYTIGPKKICSVKCAKYVHCSFWTCRSAAKETSCAVLRSWMQLFSWKSKITYTHI